jgi:ferrous-iron efflux pump FieF
MDLPITPERREALLRLASRASVLTASVLLAAKLGAWLLSGSVSLLASLADSLMDGAASLITLFAVRWALQPADNEHRFGHGKAEALAGLGQATFIAGSAVFLVLQAIDRLLHPAPVEHAVVGVVVMVFSILLTAGLLVLQRWVVRLTGSAAIAGDALHYATDLISNLAIIAALVLAELGWPGLDPIFGLLIAAGVVKSAWGIGNNAVRALMDHELPAETQAEIQRLALSMAGVLGVHDLRTRQSGPTIFIQLHLELDDSQSLMDAHHTTEAVEAALRQAHPGAEVFIHQDPVSVVKDDVLGRVRPPEPPTSLP